MTAHNRAGARFRVRVVVEQWPPAQLEPTFRGAGIAAVVGDTIAIETPDGTLVGELVCGYLETDNTPITPPVIAFGADDFYVMHAEWHGDVVVEVVLPDCMADRVPGHDHACASLIPV